MEAPSQTPAEASEPETGNRTAPADLRAWLELVEEAGELHRIAAPVSLEEELGAVTYMAARDPDGPALLFENLGGNASGVPVLANMLGASRRRFALALGLDPDGSTTALIRSMRGLLKRRIKPTEVAAETAPVTSCVSPCPVVLTWRVKVSTIRVRPVRAKKSRKLF